MVRGSRPGRMDPQGEGMAVSYTAEQLAQLKANIARGVTSLEVNGEKVTFRSLDEMRRTVAMIENEVSPVSRPGLYRPKFSRG